MRTVRSRTKNIPKRLGVDVHDSLPFYPSNWRPIASSTARCTKTMAGSDPIELLLETFPKQIDDNRTEHSLISMSEALVGLTV